MTGATAHNLCLHYVGEGGPLWHTPAELGALVDALRADGKTAATLADYLDEPPGADHFTLSFDDAHASLLDAVDVLRERGVRPTVFVPTDYVGTAPRWLDWDGLRRLRDAGWILGSHTATHPRPSWRLYDETRDDHRARLREELERSRDALARALGEAPALLAYPFGEAPEVAREAAKQAGYRAAFTVAMDGAWDGDALAIPRVEPPAAAPEGAPTGFSVVVPACDRVRILSDVVTRLASLSYPEERYEVLVVDDGSVEDLSPIFEEMPANVRLLRSDGDETFRAGQARQRGADEARFEHLAFLDADVAVGPDFLWHLDWVHRRQSRTVLLAYLSGYNLHDRGYLHTPDDVIGADLSTLPILCDRSREPALRRCLDHVGWLEEPWGLTYTGNVSLPAALLRDVGGFSRELEGWGLEDLDLGLRLHDAGARFSFSRFAVGYHVVDPSEAQSRNPFRADPPRRELFDGYLHNLAMLEARHGERVRGLAERTRRDVEEICSEPMTVGVEMGGLASVRAPEHMRLHHVQPGGVPTEELLDRVAYARKVRAKTMYLLGGAPAEHPGFLRLLREGRDAVDWISMQTLVYPFAAPGAVGAAVDAGLRGVVALVRTLDEALYERLHDAPIGPFLEGLARLEASGLERSVNLVVGLESAESFAETRASLAARGWRLEEVTLLDPGLEAPIRATLTDDPATITLAPRAPGP